MATVIQRFWCTSNEEVYEVGDEYKGKRVKELVLKGYLELDETDQPEEHNEPKGPDDPNAPKDPDAPTAPVGKKEKDGQKKDNSSGV